jgi:predicted transcriptional regulator of viral defense system
MQLHALTEQLPKAIYLTEERSRAVDSLEVEAKQDEMTQADIDAAFSRPPRTSSNSVIFRGMRIYLLQGAGTDRAGVQAMEADYEQTRQRIHVEASDVERTLIDATVRPFYSGGVGEVAAAFVEAKERVSVNRIRALLTQMRMIYLCHQAIGWYLERAGFRPAQLALLQSMPMTLDFYLAHQMTKPRYIKNWRLFVPQDF